MTNNALVQDQHFNLLHRAKRRIISASYYCVIPALLATALSTQSVSAQTQSNKTLRWSSAGDALTMDPHAKNETPTINMNRQIYDTLIQRDVNLQMEPGLAVDWQPVSDTQWVFNLRRGVTFHDGAEFSAEDVKFSIERAQAKTSDFKSYVNSIANVEILDEYRVQITTKTPDPILPSYLTFVFMMDKGWAEANNVVAPQDYNASEETYAVRHANGTGAYTLAEREPDLKTVLQSNPNYWGPKAQVATVVHTPISSEPTRIAALLSQELDFVLDPPIQDLQRLKSDERINVSSTAQIRTIFLGMDQNAKVLRSNPELGKNPLADKRVRQAMYMAIDIKAIQQKIMRGLSEPAGIITAPGVNGHTAALDQRMPYDRKKALALLSDAGYPEGFKLRLDCPNNRYISDEAICQAVVSMLSRIGIKTSLNAQPKSIFFKTVSNEESDFYLLGWGVATLDSEYVFRYLLNTRTEKAGTWNHANFSNPEVDELIAKIQQEVNLEKRNKMIEQVWQITKDDVTYLPLHHQVISWAMDSKLTLPIRASNEPLFRLAKFSN